MRTASIALFAASALAQSQYGENHVNVNLDSQLVEQTAFPAPDVTLLSPAFLPNASFDPGWSEGTEGATSQYKLGTRTMEDEPNHSYGSLTLDRGVHQQACSEESFMDDLRRGRLLERRRQDVPVRLPLYLRIERILWIHILW